MLTRVNDPATESRRIKFKPSALSNRYLSDVVEVAGLGASSCTEDIAKILREYLQGAENETYSNFSNGGCYNSFVDPEDSQSEIPGKESLNTLLMQNHLTPHILGKCQDGSSCMVYHKAGRIDGFSSCIYFLLTDRVFVVVFGNSARGYGPYCALHITRSFPTALAS
jgi:hypothetical protein